MPMLSEVGSNFWDFSLDSPQRCIPLWWETDDYHRIYFKSGRNAIKAICRALKINNTKVLLPAYTCETVIQPFLDEGWSVDFYRINKDLTVDDDFLKNKVEEFKPSVVLFHSYFGFDTLISSLPLIKRLHDSGIIVIEDITQSLFSNHYIKFADYYVGSLRKFLAIPDGGVLISKTKLSISGIMPADKEVFSVAKKAFEEKSLYMKSEIKGPNLKDKFREHYKELNCLIAKNDKLTEITNESKVIWASCDIEQIRSKRFKNYEFLNKFLKDISGLDNIVSRCMKGIAPLYMPIYVKNNRLVLQEYLAANYVYCPVIWPMPKQIQDIDNETKYMYEHMLCLPIDQRYGCEEMKKIISLLRVYDCDGRK